MQIRFLITVLACIASTSAASAQERQWALDATEREAFLVFGVPDTDDVGVSFWCEVGSKKLSAFLPANLSALREGEKTVMKLDVDGTTFQVPSKAEKNQTTGKFTVEGGFQLNEKLAEVLPRGQELKIAIKGHTTTYPLVDADFAGLFAVCSAENLTN